MALLTTEDGTTHSKVGVIAARAAGLARASDLD